MTDKLVHNGANHKRAEVYVQTGQAPYAHQSGLIVSVPAGGTYPVMGGMWNGENYVFDPLQSLLQRVDKLTADLNAVSLRVEDLMRRIVNMEATYEHTITQANQERDQWMVLVEDLRDLNG